MTVTSAPADAAHPSDLRLAAIDDALARYAVPQPGCPAPLEEAIRYALLGPGKRLRPRLVLMAAEACGGDPQQALPAAAAVEMIHAYSLVHDDLPAMDNDDLRRGRPTCHVQFDEATAILVGDALQARAFELMAKEIKPPEAAASCCAVLAEAAGAAALVGGQADDLSAENLPPTIVTLEAIHARKTGALFRASVRLGALTAGAGEAQLEALDRYATDLGLAFQVVDDLLDICGEESVVGKRLSKDSDRGKLTYPDLIGVDESRRLVEDLIGRAEAALADFGERAEPLIETARFVAARNS
ncbi:MAG: polyprenyl synthetase family protein [Planctomycetota bacterium]